MGIVNKKHTYLRINKEHRLRHLLKAYSYCQISLFQLILAKSVNVPSV